jgi:arabinogalactan endo-1,4-beta-galactosidase
MHIHTLTGGLKCQNYVRKNIAHSRLLSPWGRFRHEAAVCSVILGGASSSKWARKWSSNEWGHGNKWDKGVIFPQ